MLACHQNRFQQTSQTSSFEISLFASSYPLVVHCNIDTNLKLWTLAFGSLIAGGLKRDEGEILHLTLQSYQNTFQWSVLPQGHSNVNKDDTIADHENGDILRCCPVDLILQRSLCTGAHRKRGKEWGERTRRGYTLHPFGLKQQILLYLWHVSEGEVGGGVFLVFLDNFKKLFFPLQRHFKLGVVARVVVEGECHEESLGVAVVLIWGQACSV